MSPAKNTKYPINLTKNMVLKRLLISIPAQTRTGDPLIRTEVLYPSELRGQTHRYFNTLEGIMLNAGCSESVSHCVRVAETLGSIPSTPTRGDFGLFYEPIEWLIKLIGSHNLLFNCKVQEYFSNHKVQLPQNLGFSYSDRQFTK